jgi:putative membrane protein
MKKQGIVLLLMINSVCMIMSAQMTPDQKKIKKDIHFAECADRDGLMEVRLGELAQNNATNQDVKSEAKQMIDDHGKANEELKAIAVKKNISLPTSIGVKKQKGYDKLASLNGAKFDKKYVKCMVKAHKKAICLFKKESKRGNDPELKAWALAKIPTLQQHLQMWKSTCKTLK